MEPEVDGRGLLIKEVTEMQGKLKRVGVDFRGKELGVGGEEKVAMLNRLLDESYLVSAFSLEQLKKGAVIGNKTDDDTVLDLIGVVRSSINRSVNPEIATVEETQQWQRRTEDIKQRYGISIPAINPNDLVILNDPDELEVVLQWAKVSHHVMAGGLAGWKMGIALLKGKIDRHEQKTGERVMFTQEDSETVLGIFKDGMEVVGSVVDIKSSLDKGEFPKTKITGWGFFGAFESALEGVVKHPISGKALQVQVTTSIEEGLNESTITFNDKLRDWLCKNLESNMTKAYQSLAPGELPDEPAVSVDVTREARDNKSGVVVRLTDNAVGMPEDLVKSGSFIEGKSEWKEGVAGSGSGMAVLAKVIDRFFGGSLVPKSRSDGKKGAVVELWLPMG